MLEKSVLLLTLVLFLALGTERLVELFRALSDHLEARYGSFVNWHALADKTRRSIELRLQSARADSPIAFQMALFMACRHLSPVPAGRIGGSLAVEVAQVRKMIIRICCKLIAMAFGIWFAFILDLNIVALVQQELSPDRVKEREDLWPCVETLVTGIAMGLGAGPVHTMITALERARQKRLQE